MARLHRSIGFQAGNVGVLLLAVCTVAAQQAPVHVLSEQDHQRTLDLLKIAALRQGADADNPRGSECRKLMVAATP
jgi:hypothetical protein